jgi:hypothetical protein
MAPSARRGPFLLVLHEVAAPGREDVRAAARDRRRTVGSDGSFRARDHSGEGTIGSNAAASCGCRQRSTCRTTVLRSTVSGDEVPGERGGLAARLRLPRRHGWGWTGRRTATVDWKPVGLVGALETAAAASAWAGLDTAHCRLETHRPGRGSRDCGCRNPSAWVGLNGAAHCGCRLETRRPGRGS